MHPIAESVYEAIIVVFLPDISWWETGLSVGALVLNMALQCVFLLVISTSFQADTIPAIEDVKRWRMAEGHTLSLQEGPTLVSRVCGQDITLGVAQDKIALLSVLRLYNEAGTALAVATLIVFILSISSEVRACVGFQRGIWHLPRATIVEIADEDGTLKIFGMSFKCLAFLSAIQLARLFLALTLGYAGSAWLAKETKIANLVLNAGALAFILELEQTVYFAVTSMRITSIVKKIAPLTKASGGRIQEIVHKLVLIASLLFVAIVSGVVLVPMHKQVATILSDMCGGPMDFAIAQHKTGLFMAAATPAFSPLPIADIPGYFFITDVFKNGVQAPSTEFLLAESYEIFVNLAWSDVDYLVAAITNNACLDHDDAFNGDPRDPLTQVAHAVQRQPWHLSVSACQDVRLGCGRKEDFLVRALCPVSCGCARPRSGLWNSGPDSGCPHEGCSATTQYSAAIRTLPCRDEAPAVLAQMQEWAYLCNQLVAIPAIEFELEAAHASILAEGCAYFSRQPEDTLRLYCRRLLYATGLVAFCPEACQCATKFIQGCPPACTNSTSASGEG